MILLALMAFFCAIALGCLSVRVGSEQKLPAPLMISGLYFLIGAMACLYLLVFGRIN